MRSHLLFPAAIFLTLTASAQTLLDPLTSATNTPVTRKLWPTRRAEVLTLFEQDVFGKVPASAQHLPVHAHVDEQSSTALEGRATRRQVTLSFGFESAPAAPQQIHLILYLPNRCKGKTPIILGLSFAGNQTILDDPAILIHPTWKASPQGKGEPPIPPILDNPSESTRGTQTQQWQVEKILARGYGIAVYYYGDLDPDFKAAIPLGIRPHFYAAGQTEPRPDDWGALSVWAWGLSRAFDYLAADPEIAPRIDATHIAVTGHSRLGKAADWAAATDLRFAALLSTESGKGGQSVSRHLAGETIAHLARSFPYWFCGNYQQFIDHDAGVPFDGNLLLSLIAPRPLYVASAEQDANSDPLGEYLSALSASRVYTLLRKPALTSPTLPAIDTPTAPSAFVAYHIRSGKHDVTAYDWDQYLNFLDAHFPSQH